MMTINAAEIEALLAVLVGGLGVKDNASYHGDIKRLRGGPNGKIGSECLVPWSLNSL